MNKPCRRQYRAALLAQFVFLLLCGWAFAANAAVDVNPSFDAVDPTSYTPGDTASFTLTISNDGADDTAVAEIELDAYAGASGTTAASGITFDWSCSANDAGSDGDTACPSPASGTDASSLNHTSVDIGAGESLTYSITLNATSAASSDPVRLVAETNDNDTTTGGQATQSLTRDAETDFTLSFSPSSPTGNPTTVYIPGSTGNSFSVSVGNNGPSDSQPAAVTIVLPAEVSAADWDCSPVADCSLDSGNGDVSTSVSVDVGETVTISFSNVSYSASASAATIDFDASVDPDDADQSGAVSLTNTYEREVHADYAVGFNPASPDGSPTPVYQTYVPGTANTNLEIIFSNNGPSDGAGVDAEIRLPFEVTGGTWGYDASCTAANVLTPPAPPVIDPENPPTEAPTWPVSVDNGGLGSLASGASVSVYLCNLAFDPAAIATQIRIKAELSQEDADETDSVSSNDSGDNVYNIDRQADFEVSKSAFLQAGTPATEVARGNGYYYDIEVSNHGPSDIIALSGETGLTLTDSISADLTGDPAHCGASSPPCWEYCPTGDGVAALSTCSVELASGSGSSLNVNLTDLPVGESRVFRLYVASQQTVDNGVSINNTATATMAGNTAIGQPTPDNTDNSDIATVTVLVQSVLSVDVDDGETLAVAGDSHSYQVTVSNTGFVSTPAVSLDVNLPIYPGGTPSTGFIAGSIGWQCSAFDGACCNHNSSTCGTSTPTPVQSADGLTDHLLGLPAQSHVVFTFTGDLHADASGTMQAHAQIEPPAGISDSDASDNTDSDNDTALVAQSGLSLDKRLLRLDPVAGQLHYHLVYQVDVGNSGPSVANGVSLSDPLSDTTFDPASAQWCDITGAPGSVSCSSATTGAFATSVNLAVGQSRQFLIEVDTDDTPSGQITNTVSLDWGSIHLEDTVIASIGGEADLQISNFDNYPATPPGTAPGTDNQYTVVLENHGPADVFGASVTDFFPSTLENTTWTCSAITPIPGDLSAASVAGPGNSAGGELVTTLDGRHVYQLVSDSNGNHSLQAYAREDVPGVHFGDLTVIDSEVNGVNDPDDAGVDVSGMLQPIDLALSSNNAYLYVLSYTDNPDPTPDTAHLVMFNRSGNPAAPDYGHLTFATSIPLTDLNHPLQVATANSSLYVLSRSGIRSFELDPSSGLPVEDELTAVTGADRIVVSPAQKLLFVAGADSGAQVRAYRVGDGGGSIPAGRLSEVATLNQASLGSVTELLLGPEHQHLYAMSYAGGGVLQLIEYSDDGSSVTLNAGHGYTSTDVSGWNGVIPGTANDLPADTLVHGNRLAIPADGEHLIVSVAEHQLLVQLRRDTDSGGLSYEAQYQRAAPNRVGVVADPLRFSVDGRHLLDALGTTDTLALEVIARRAPDPRFALVEVDRQGDLPGPVTGINAPSDIATSPDGKHLYAVSLGGDHALSVFERHDSLGLTAATAGQHLTFVSSYHDGVNGVDGLEHPRKILVSPNGTLVFVSSSDDNSVAVFNRNATSGELSFQSVFRDGQNGVNALLGAAGMAMDSGSTHLYVAAQFEQAIAIFRNNAGTLAYVGEVRGGVNGVVGLQQIHALTLSADGTQLLGASRGDSGQGRAVVFRRETNSADPDYGKLDFVQSLLIGAQLPSAIALSRGPNPGDDRHVYITAEGSSEIVVLNRIIDPGSPDNGKLLPLYEYLNGAGGISNMSGPRDIAVSRDGHSVFVAAANSNAVLVFDRDANPGSINYGGLTLSETRRDNLEGIDGIGNVYALAISPVSAFVYAAGFNDAAVASFAVGSGSSCSASGSGDIEDTVNIARNGTLKYTINTHIRPDAAGMLETTATVATDSVYTDPTPGDRSATDQTWLFAKGDLSIEKTNNQVSVVAGERVNYDIVVRNAGPSNLGDAAGIVRVSDLLPGTSGFVPASATWTCTASNSGALEFVDAHFDGDAGLDGLAGANGVALLTLSGSAPTHLVVAGVSDNAISIFRIDPVSGALSHALTVKQGDSVDPAGGGSPVLVGSLDGVSELVASGGYLYASSRISDAVTVFALTDDGTTAAVQLVDVEQGSQLNQAQHLALSPDQAFLYVAAANADSVSTYALDSISGALSLVESETNGIDDAGDAGGVVAGLDNVEFVVVSPDGAQLYALSGSSGSISRFDRDAVSGRLNYRTTQNGSSFATTMQGASAAAFDSSGAFLYVAATQANRVLVLARDTALGSGFGSLTLASTVHQGEAGAQGLLGPSGLALSADGDHVYVTSQDGDAVAWFQRDASDGALGYLGQRSSISGSVQGLGGAGNVLIDDDNGQVYVSAWRDGAVSQFARQADSWCPASGSGPIDDVEVRVAAGGSLTFHLAVDLRTDLAGNTTVSNVATVSTDDETQDTDTSNNSAEDEDANASQADLSISKDDGLAEYDGIAGAQAIVGDIHNLYVAGSDDNAIGIISRIDDVGQPDDGVIGFTDLLRDGENGVQGLSGVSDLLLSPDGAQLYAASPVQGSVAVFERLADGRLNWLEVHQHNVLGVSGLSGARALASDSGGNQLYAIGGFSNSIATFDRNTDDGSANYGRLGFRAALQHNVGGVLGMAGPVALAVAPDGKQVYVLAAENDTIAVFNRNPNSGSGSFGQLNYARHYVNGSDGIVGMAGVRSLVFSDDANLYVLAADTGHVHHFSRDANGNLTPEDVLADGGGNSGLTGASRLRLSADGTQIYVAATADDAILTLDIGAGGALSFGARIAAGDADADCSPNTPPCGAVLGLDGVSDVAPAAAGAQLYSVSKVDSAVDHFALTAGALDYRQSLFDGLGGIAPGDTVTYRIEVGNAGPSDTLAQVVDNFPAAFDSVSWTCTASGSAGCAPGLHTGNVNTQVSLPVGSSVLILASGVVGENAAGGLVNTATVSANGAIDPDIGNNTATDDNTVLSPAVDLVVSVDDALTEATPGGTVSYTVAVANVGPSYANDVQLEDQLPAALYNAEWTCTAMPVAGGLSDPQSEPLPVALNSHTGLVISSDGQDAYALGEAAGIASVVHYARDPLTGSLSAPVVYSEGNYGITGLAGASSLVLSGDGRFIYVAGQLADAIVVFARDTGLGGLNFVTRYVDGDPGIDGIGGVADLLLSPGSDYLYAAGYDDDAIAVFSVNGSNGHLSKVGEVRQGQSGLDGLNGVRSLSLNADGSRLFALADINTALSVFERNSGNGLLTPISNIQDFSLSASEQGALANPVRVRYHDGRAVVTATGGLVTAFALDEAAATPFSVVWQIDGLNSPVDTAFAADQARLYIADADGVHLYSLMAANPVALADYPVADHADLAQLAGITVSANGKQLYSAGNGTGALVVWQREYGSRCPLSGSGPLRGLAVDIAPLGSVSFTLDGRIYANAEGNLSYTVSAEPRTDGEELNASDNAATDTDTLVPAPDLSATKLADQTEVVAGTPISWQIGLFNAGVSDALAATINDPAPLFPTDANGLLQGSGGWTCTANAPLALDTGIDSSTQPQLAGVADGVVSPDGQWLYAVSASANALLVFPRAADGSLAAATVISEGDVHDAGVVSGLDAASAVAVSPDGQQVLVTGQADNSLVVFDVDDSGALQWRQTFVTSSGGVIGLTGPVDVAISADGALVAVAAPGGESIALFSRDSANGAMQFLDRVRDGTGSFGLEGNVIKGVRQLAFSSDGNTLYAVASLSDTVSWYAVDRTGGSLEFQGVRREGETAHALNGSKALALAAGDSGLYVLGDSEINLYSLDADGALAWSQRFDAIPGLQQAQAFALDTAASRLYLADSDGSIRVFNRDWSNGALDLRHHFVDPGLGLSPVGLLSAEPSLYALSASSGHIDRLMQQAMSRCLSALGPDPTADDQPDGSLDLGVNGWANLVFNATVDPSARGVLVNDAIVAPSNGADPDPVNNTGTASTPITVVSDLSISKTGPTTAVAGERIEYLIHVDNAGPSSALGATISDNFAAAIIAWDWACTATAGSECASSGTGSGNLSIPVNILPLGSVDVVVSALIDPAYLGALDNQVSIIPEPGSTDPDTDDQSSDSPTADVHAEFDLAVSKDDGVTEVTAGLQTTYQIVVSNPGPSDAPMVQVQDLLPDALVAPNWTCVGNDDDSDGDSASCPGSTGVGDIDFLASVPAGDSLDITYVTTVHPFAEGQVLNVVSAMTQDAAIERDPVNNSDDDLDSILISHDLSVQVLAELDPIDPRSVDVLPVRLVYRNAGPSGAHDVVLTMNLSAPAQFIVPDGCIMTTSTQMRCEFAQLSESMFGAQIELAMVGLPDAPGTFTISAHIEARDSDPDTSNNDASDSVTLVSGADIAVSIDNSRDSLEPGDTVQYLIHVFNHGSQPLSDVAISVAIQAELLNPGWVCSSSTGVACSSGSGGNLSDTLTMDSGDAVTYLLTVTVDPGLLDSELPILAHVQVDATVPGGDYRTSNNSAFDDDLIFRGIFKDGFEDLPILRQLQNDVLQARECAMLPLPRPPACSGNPLQGGMQ